MADAGKSIGTVKWFSGPKGFGFVTPDDGGDDLFVHQTEIQSHGFRTLRQGQRVQFNFDTREDGRIKAVDVVILGRTDTRRGRSRAYGRPGNGVECYNCGRIGHLARDCYRGYGRRGGGNGGGGRQCYSCREEGHLARDCPVDQT